MDQKIADLHAQAKATTAKAKSVELRKASATISITKAESEKILGDMRSESTRHANTIATLLSKHSKLNAQYDMAA